MRAIPLHDLRATADAASAEAIRAAVQRLRTLGDVLTWSRSATRSRQPTTIVTQDEYTHDVVFDLDGASYLAFDTT